MSKLLFGLLTAVIVSAGSAAAAPRAPKAPQADKEAIRAHLAFLADDLLEGRATGTRGFDIAANYVASQFTQYHLVPKGDKGGYLQGFALRSTTQVPASALVEIASASGVVQMSATEDFVLALDGGVAPLSAPRPLVFVGYGIRAERFKHDDFAGLDVKGKIVVNLQGYPGTFPGEEGAHFGSQREKGRLAAQLGAAGMVTLWTPLSEANFPFKQKVLASGHFSNSIDWLNPAGKPGGQLAGMQDTVYLGLPGARKLFPHADVQLDDVYAAAAANKPLPRVHLKTTMRIAHRSESADIASSNVVGMIEGSDPLLKNEYVVFTAHLDHLGQSKEKIGDNIYNGAMDNASGVATLIETARMFSQSARKPRRSILFIALTGEEKGLVGSGYFAANPSVPVGAIVADINLDMPLLTFDFKNVMAFGSEHSSLKGNAERALKALGLGLIPDPWPAKGLFVRSDHYNFVRQGIPSIFLATGMASFNKDEDAAKLWDEFREKRYHQPSDDLSQPINYAAAARFATVNYNIGRDIADTPARPTWNKGNFFGDTFRK